MSEQSPQSDQVAGSAADVLTPQQQVLLKKDLDRLETEIFNRVFRRLSAWVAAAVGILLIGGVIELKACSTNVESAAVERLSKDPELRDNINSKAQQRIDSLEQKLRDIENNTGREAAGMSSDLQQIRSMINRVGEELSKSAANRLGSPAGQGNGSP